MSKITIIGKALASDGFTQQRHRSRTRSWITRPEQLRSSQPRSRLYLEHEKATAIGRVVALERDHAGLWATCELDVSQPRLVQFRAAGPWFYSAEIDAIAHGVERTDVILTGLGLVRKPAGLGLDPVVVLDGPLEPHAIDNHWHHLPSLTRDRLHRAVDQVRSRDTALTVITDRAPAPSLDMFLGRSSSSLSAAEHQMLLDAQDEQAWQHRARLATRR